MNKSSASQMPSCPLPRCSDVPEKGAHDWKAPPDDEHPGHQATVGRHEYSTGQGQCTLAQLQIESTFYYPTESIPLILPEPLAVLFYLLANNFCEITSGQICQGQEQGRTTHEVLNKLCGPSLCSPKASGALSSVQSFSILAGGTFQIGRSGTEILAFTYQAY